jgi:hypothetical protein
MSQQLLASTERPPRFGERDLATIADSREVHCTETDLPAKPQHGVADLRDLLLVAERRPGSVALVDTTRHEVVDRVANVGRAPHSIVFHSRLPANTRAGAYAYTQSRQGWVSKIDLFGGELVARVRGGTSGRAIATSADGAYVAAGYYNPNHVVIFDGETLEPLQRIATDAPGPDGDPVDSRVCTVLDVPAERCFAVVLKDAGRVWFVDYEEPSVPVVEELEVGPVLHDGVFSPDGRLLFLASQGAECLFAVDVRERRVVGRIPTAGPPHPTPGAIDRERGIAFTGTVMTDAVTAWDLDTLDPVGDVQVPGHGMFLASHPDCSMLWGDVIFDDTDRDNEGLCYLLDPAEMSVDRVVDTRTWCPGRSLHPEFTRDGQHVYVSCWDAGQLLVFDSETGQFTARIDDVTTPTGSFLGDRATRR